ncbi:MAG: hypothetical protein JO125_08060 [Chloroflexi bacterium]|nr:hypothetical protein [Chloroflexota bacterium]
MAKTPTNDGSNMGRLGDERMETLLPVLDRLMQRGMITVSSVEIILAEEQAER